MGKVAVVTGANQGIGFGIVRRLCKEHPSWTVYGTSRSAANGNEACNKLKEEGLAPKFVQADLTKPETISMLKDFLVKEHGGIDVLVNNAGISFKQAATDPYAVQVEATMDTNVFGTDSVCQHLFPILNDGARVVILSGSRAFTALHKVKILNAARYESFIRDPPMPWHEVLNVIRDFVTCVKAGTDGDEGWPNNSGYSVSKLGNTLMARAYQRQLDETAPERDIVVNAADPGTVSTNMSSYTGSLTIDEGADTPYYLAVLSPKTDIRGEHVSKRQVVPWK